MWLTVQWSRKPRTLRTPLVPMSSVIFFVLQKRQLFENFSFLKKILFWKTHFSIFFYFFQKFTFLNPILAIRKRQVTFQKDKQITLPMSFSLTRSSSALFSGYCSDINRQLHPILLGPRAPKGDPRISRVQTEIINFDSMIDISNN